MLKYWTLDPKIIFLNHGSFGATPKVVTEAERRLYDRMESEPVRWVREELYPLLGYTRKIVADYVGANSTDIVIVPNATTATNALLRSFPFKKGDKILHTNFVYAAVRTTMQYVSKVNSVTLVEIPLQFPISNQQIIQAFVDYMNKNPEIVLIILDHITSPTAITMPIEKIIDEAHKRGMQVFVDGAHVMANLPINLNKLNADYYTSNGHKWLATSKGAAFLWVRADHQDMVHPTVISFGYLQGYAQEFQWTGTNDYSAFFTFPVAIEFNQALGTTKVMNYIHDLATSAANNLAQKWKTRVLNPPEQSSAMAVIQIPKSNYTADYIFNKLFQDYNIEVPVYPLDGNTYVRISSYIYNAKEDYDLLGDAVLKIIG